MCWKSSAPERVTRAPPTTLSSIQRLVERSPIHKCSIAHTHPEHKLADGFGIYVFQHSLIVLLPDDRLRLQPNASRKAAVMLGSILHCFCFFILCNVSSFCSFALPYITVKQRCSRITAVCVLLWIPARLIVCSGHAKHTSSYRCAISFNEFTVFFSCIFTAFSVHVIVSQFFFPSEEKKTSEKSGHMLTC